MTKAYIIVSLVLLVAVLAAALVFTDAGQQLAVSWNSLPVLHWTADTGGAWSG